MWIILTLIAIALVALFDYIKESKKTDSEKILDKKVSLLNDIFLGK